MQRFMNLIGKHRSYVPGLFLTIVVLLFLISAPVHAPTLAAGNNCTISGPVSGSYTINICITNPTDNATVSGLQTVSASISMVTGTNPGVGKLIFYLDGQYLITDYQNTYVF